MKLSGLILMPVYTTYLSPEDYGILNTLYAFSNLLPLFISLSLESSFSRYYFHEKTISARNVKELYSTLFWFILLWGGIVTFLSLVAAPYLFQSFPGIPYWPYIPLAVIPMFLSQLTVLGAMYLRNTLRTRLFTVMNFARFALATSIILILLISYNMGILANLYGICIGAIFLFGGYLFFSIRFSLLGFCFKQEQLSRSLRYSLPLLPSMAGSWIAGLSDRLILAYYGRIPEVGLYSISAMVSRLMYFAIDAITQVQGPISMSALTEDREIGKQKIAEFLSVFIWGAGFTYLLLTFFSKELLYVFTDARYHSAYKLVAILAFTYVLGGVYRPFATIISFHARTGLITMASLFSALVNAVLNFAFIPMFGQWAAAWSTLFSVCVYAGWVIFWAQKIDPISLDIKLIASIVKLGGGVLCVQQLFDMQIFVMPIWAIFLIKCGLLSLYVAIIFYSSRYAVIRCNVLKFVLAIGELRRTSKI